jgi:hypothetical protein
VLACLLAATGCLASNPGRPFDTTHIPEITPGTDQGALIAWFGEPFTKEDMGGGGCAHRWVWYSAPAQLLFVNLDGAGKVCAH